MLKKLFVALGVVGILAAAAVYGALRYYQSASSDPSFFEDDVHAFEAAERDSPAPPGSVVFTGSSSIRLWDSLAEDMAPLVARNRGFGGSQISHLVHFGPRLLPTATPAALVVYSGDNDLEASTGKTARDVLEDYQTFVRIVHDAHPQTQVFIISIKPSKLRWSRWPIQHEANLAVEAWTSTHPRLHYLDIASPMLGSDGKPRGELFAFDGLHLNEPGYALWTDIVRPRLLAEIGVEN